MSMFVQVQSIKASPTLTYNQTQKPLSNSNLSRDVIVCIEHFLRSEYVHQAYKSKLDEQQWVLNKSVFSIPLAEQETIATLLAGEKKVNNYKLLSNNQDEFRMLLKTPISLLLSEDKRERVVEKVQKSHQIPLYSDQCKIIASFYLFEKEVNKQRILQSLQNDQPIERIQIKRKQLMDTLKNFNQKSKHNRSQSPLQQSPQKYTFENYEASLNSIKSNPKTEEQFRTYSYTVQPKNRKLQIRHGLKIQFIIAVEKLRECAGFMRAGYSRGFSMNNKNLNINTQNNGSFSQYVSSSNAGSRVGNKNFGYDLNFSTVRADGQKYVHHQSTGQKQKGIYEPDLKSPNRPIRQPVRQTFKQSTKEPNKQPVLSRIKQSIRQNTSRLGESKRAPIKQSKEPVKGTMREQLNKEHKREQSTKQLSTFNQTQQISGKKGFFMSAFDFACCKQAKDDEQFQINFKDPSSLNYESHKDEKEKNFQNNQEIIPNRLNQKNLKTQAKLEAYAQAEGSGHYMSNKPVKIKQPKQMVNFYKGPCKSKNLFSVFDPKRQDQIFTPLEPHY